MEEVKKIFKTAVCVWNILLALTRGNAEYHSHAFGNPAEIRSVFIPYSRIIDLLHELFVIQFIKQRPKPK
jgi:hypothetical protein